MRYIANVWDILIHGTSHSQRAYRVSSIHLGALGEEGYVVLQSLGMIDRAELRVPAMLLDDAVERGVMKCVWREREKSGISLEAAAERIYAAMLVAARPSSEQPCRWVPNGNSRMQDEARAAAREILANPPAREGA